MSQVTFSSSVLVDDETTPTSRFPTFTLDVDDRQALELLRDENQARFGMTFVGSGARAAHAALAPLECRHLLNGQPSMTIDGYLVAACIGQGELVQVTLPVLSRGAPDDLELVTRVGIITNLVWSAAGSPSGQRLDLVFHACHRLHVRSGSLVVTFTDPLAAEPLEV